jgi:flagellar biogenesis protein FliO
MFIHLACLPLAAVLINDVRTESSGGAMTVDVATSEPVSIADVRGVSGGPRRMFVYVQGAQASRKSFGGDSDAVVVHPRARYTKLEIPTDGRCAEPMVVEATAAGIRVRAACQNSGMPAGLLAPPVRLPGKDHAEQPSPDAPMAAQARRRSQSESLRAALALPAEATDKESDVLPAEDSGHGGATTEASAKKAEPGAVAPAAPEKAADHGAANAGQPAVPPKTAALAPTTQPDAPMAALASTELPSPSASGSSGGESKSSSGTLSTLLAVLLLVGLGVAATLLTRRRATRTRMIRIVETASIGPRRSLVVACIGGRTMVLGVSEAGVSLLDTQGGNMAAPAAPERSQSASLEEAAFGLRGFGQADTQEASAQTAQSTQSTDDGKHEGSLLSRLFRRELAPSATAGRAHEFDELLAESLDDQELRRKLSLGEAGRVA